MKIISESAIFDGGSEVSPEVSVVKYWKGYKSFGNGEPILEITQAGKTVYIAPDTIQDILAWYMSSRRVITV
jgi:hypothetical protein